MRQAITTKYLGATDYRGGRVKAYAQAGTITIPWDDALDVGPNHRRAAQALIDKYGWTGDWYGGALPEHSKYAYCWVQVR